MIHRILASLVLFFALTACGGTATTPQAGVDCPDGMATCTPELGPPVMRYCPYTAGACEGHPIRPEDVTGALFAGVTVTGTGDLS